MALKDIIQTGVRVNPYRLLLYGMEGIGKTLWASKSPSPIFLGTEDGLGFIDAESFPAVSNWASVLKYIQFLLSEEHKYKTLVIDTADHLERLAWVKIVESSGKTYIKSIEDIPYGKGYIQSLEIFSNLCNGLDRLRSEKRMNIILLAHGTTVSVQNPEGPDYQKFSLKLHKKTSDYLREWCDVVLFAGMDFDVIANDSGSGRTVARGPVRGKAASTDTAPPRKVWTSAMPSFDAKNRFNLPFELPLEYSFFEAAMRSSVIAARAAAAKAQSADAAVSPPSSPVPEGDAEKPEAIVEVPR